MMEIMYGKYHLIFMKEMKAEQAIVCGIVRTSECSWQWDASLRA